MRFILGTIAVAVLVGIGLRLVREQRRRQGFLIRLERAADTQ